MALHPLSDLSYLQKSLPYIATTSFVLPAPMDVTRSPSQNNTTSLACPVARIPLIVSFLSKSVLMQGMSPEAPLRMALHSLFALHQELSPEVPRRMLYFLFSFNEEQPLRHQRDNALVKPYRGCVWTLRKCFTSVYFKLSFQRLLYSNQRPHDPLTDLFYLLPVLSPECLPSVVWYFVFYYRRTCQTMRDLYPQEPFDAWIPATAASLLRGFLPTSGTPFSICEETTIH